MSLLVGIQAAERQICRLDDRNPLCLVLRSRDEVNRKAGAQEIMSSAPETARLLWPWVLWGEELPGEEFSQWGSSRDGVNPREGQPV